jgi:WD40 repeat protein
MKRTLFSSGLGFVLLFSVASLGAQAETWSFTGSMQQARLYPSATLLPNGQVLVVGGYHRGLIVGVAELYNPVSGTFTTTGSLNTARYAHTATLLPNGKVLIAGGQNTSGVLASTELYDPSTGTFTVGPSLSCGCGAEPTLLANGMVLFSGGFNGSTAIATAQLYDPTANAFSSTGSLKVARAGHSSILLPSGKVLIAGGVFYTGTPPYNLVANYLASAELYDPATGTFSFTGSLKTARSGNTATVLPNGTVLLAAGENDGANGGYLGSAEIYDPSTGKFTFTGSLITARFLHTAHLLASGEVLIVAGNYHGSLASAELYNPATGKFGKTASLNTPRQGHRSVLLSNGQVLALGGYESQLGSYVGYLASAELFP